MSGNKSVLRGVMKPGDWVLIIGAVALSVVTAVLVWLPGRVSAGVANIYLDSQLVMSLPLSEDGTYTVHADGGENVVEVKAGRARMLSADCADEYCVRQGYIEFSGETVICLPHRVVIELEAEEESGLDAIAS